MGEEKVCFAVQINLPCYISFSKFSCVTRAKFHNNDKDKKECDLIRKTSSFSNKNIIKGIPPIIHLNELILIYIVRDVYIGTWQTCSLKTVCSRCCQIIHFLCLPSDSLQLFLKQLSVYFAWYFTSWHMKWLAISPLVKLLPLALTSLLLLHPPPPDISMFHFLGLLLYFSVTILGNGVALKIRGVLPV